MKKILEPDPASPCDSNFLIYDGECPFCSRYVDMVRFREAVGPISLIDARQGGEKVELVQSKGFDLDEGMVLKLGNDYFHGADCIHRIALMTTPYGFLNALNALIFKSTLLSRILYPVLRFFRNVTLKVLRRSRLNEDRAIALGNPPKQ